MTIKAKLSLAFGLMTVLVLALAFTSFLTGNIISGNERQSTAYGDLFQRVQLVAAARDEFGGRITEENHKKVIDAIYSLQTKIEELGLKEQASVDMGDARDQEMALSGPTAGVELNAETPSTSPVAKTKLDALQIQVEKFIASYDAFALTSFKLKALTERNSENVAGFVNTAKVISADAQVRSEKLGRLLERVSDNIDKALTDANNQGLKNLVIAGSRVQEKVDVGREVELLGKGLLEHILSVRNTELQFLLAEDPALADTINQQVKAVFTTILKIKKLDPQGVGKDASSLLKNVNEIRKTFASIQQLAIEKRDIRNAMALSSAMVQEIVDTLREEAQTTSEQVIELASLGKLAMVVFSLVAALVISFVMTRSIVKPVGEVTTVMQAMKMGDYETPVSGIGRRDEFGVMLEAIEVFRCEGLETRRLREEQKQTEQRAAETRRQIIRGMANDLEHRLHSVVDRINLSITRVEQTSTALSGNAQETSEEARIVSETSLEAASNVATVSAASQQLSVSIDEISSRVEQIADQLNTSVEGAKAASSRVEGLSEAAGAIGNVVGLIQDIAEQTNLLALNATIESARAGEAGKGFAVVATEVKNLAAQTAQATADIESQIAEIQKRTEDSADAIAEVTGGIKSVDEMADAIAESMASQREATGDIAQNASMAAEGTQNVNSRINRVADAAVHTDDLSRQLNSAALELEEESKSLSEQINTVLKELRSDAA